MNDQVKKNEETLEALRRAEQKYRSIFEHCLEGIFQTTQGQCLAMGMSFSEKEKNLFAGHLRRDFLSSRA